MTVRILCGDCRELLHTLPDESVHCVVTSPPYWGLRDYGIGGQMGLETSLGEHVTGMVAVFREVRRVLRKDGTLWLNYGDSYAASVNGRSAHDTKLKGEDDRTFRDKPFSTIGPRGRNRNGLAGFDAGYLKPKDLCGVPWRVAFALQEDGWWLRQDIIWSKPNPMPESVTDRCTKAHEYLFLLAKSERYYFDQAAIAEPANYPDGPGNINPIKGTGLNGFDLRANLHKIGPTSTRNKRSVWEVTTQPFSEAHFATFPPALIEPCIKAGTSERGCCSKCGAPWRREIEISYEATERQPPPNKGKIGGFQERAANMTRDGFVPNRDEQTSTFGWSPSCRCDAEVVPCTVLDPFGGAGTTGLVADRLQRNAILIELNPQYAEMAEQRLRSDAPLFMDIALQQPPAEQQESPG